jgi:hypothetical protein
MLFVGVGKMIIFAELPPMQEDGMQSYARANPECSTIL